MSCLRGFRHTLHTCLTRCGLLYNACNEPHRMLLLWSGLLLSSLHILHLCLLLKPECLEVCKQLRLCNCQCKQRLLICIWFLECCQCWLHLLARHSVTGSLPMMCVIMSGVCDEAARLQTRAGMTTIPVILMCDHLQATTASSDVIIITVGSMNCSSSYHSSFTRNGSCGWISDCVNAFRGMPLLHRKVLTFLQVFCHAVRLCRSWTSGCPELRLSMGVLSCECRIAFRATTTVIDV